MRRKWFAVALAALALSNGGCFRLCERWFGPNCGGCCAPCGPRREAPLPRGEERIPPAALPSAPIGGAPPATLPPVPGGTGVGAYGGT